MQAPFVAVDLSIVHQGRLVALLFYHDYPVVKHLAQTLGGHSGVQKSRLKVFKNNLLIVIPTQKKLQNVLEPNNPEEHYMDSHTYLLE